MACWERGTRARPAMATTTPSGGPWTTDRRGAPKTAGTRTCTPPPPPPGLSGPPTLYAFARDGAPLPGWPVQVPQDYRPTLAAADLDLDGDQGGGVQGNWAQNRGSEEHTPQPPSPLS